MKMKMVHTILFAIIFICVNAFTAMSSTENEGTEKLADQDEVISNASEPEDNDPADMVDNLINNYINTGRGKLIRQKIDNEGGWYGYGIAEVTVGPENPNWVKFRLLAYEKALVQVETQYLLYQNRTIRAEKANELFKNMSESVPDYQPKDLGDPGKMRILVDKLLAVGEGKLDKTLDELGIDKEQFERTPMAQRHILLTESINKLTLIESIGSLSGLIPVQTFEGFNSKKEHVIGVFCVWTPKLKQFAYDVLHSRGNIEAQDIKGKDLYKLFSQNDKMLIDQFGVRKMKDQNGYPVLISFGQWASSKKTGDARIKRKYRAIAKKQAASLAQNQLALFLSGKSMYQSSSDIGELFEEAYNVNYDNYKEEDIINQVMDGLREKSRAKAAVTISGLNQIYVWTEKHPQYGHEIVGVILKWSPVDEQVARKIREWKPETNKTLEKKAVPKEKQIEGKTGTKMSDDHMKLDDF